MPTRINSATGYAGENFRGPITDTAASLELWHERLDRLDYALQPIVHASTGNLYGVEALVRGYHDIGFESPKELFDSAFQEHALFYVDIRLREKAIAKFKSLHFHDKLVLFYNYDPRILEMPDYRPGVTERLMTNFDLSSDQICFEINEKYEISSNSILNGFVRDLQARGIKIALDDFGSGYAGFELFYHSEPNLLKFDRFLISGIETDSRKRSLCSHMVNLCKVQGVTTIAEGVETEAELLVCRRMGFDLIQGYVIEHPQIDSSQIKATYRSLIDKQDASREREESELLARRILRIEPIDIDADVRTLLDKFHDQLLYNFFPVIDSNDYPLGIIHERSIKKYIYSPFGRELLANKSVTNGLRSFMSRNPVTDIGTEQDKILEIFVNNPDSEGVIIVKDMKYFGFLDAKSLLGAINERQLAAARDTNPLTGLPGNRMIHTFIDNLLCDLPVTGCLVYLDFDHFKPFNDRFGFRQGDRTIAIFSRILRETVPAEAFIGHVGGDDFFLGFKSTTLSGADIDQITRQIRQNFEEEIMPFFSAQERQDRCYKTTDRSGRKVELPLLSVSAAIIELQAVERAVTDEEVFKLLAAKKKEAKTSPEHVAKACVGSQTLSL